MNTIRTSIYKANLLFLFVLCLQAANAFFAWMPQYVRMFLNEALFILLPSLLFLRWQRLPVAETLRLRWPGGKVALASLGIGLGLYPLSAVSAAIYQNLLGLQGLNAVVPADILPDTVPEAILAALTYAVMAPLCEEVLFRGIIQRAYESIGAGKAILFVGFLFMAFHLSLLQGLSIIPLVLVLGYVYWRSQSLPASMLTHFGANGLAALVVTQKVIGSGPATLLTSLPAVIIGLVLSGICLFWLRRVTLPEPEPQTDLSLEEQPSRLRRAAPLLVAGLIILFMWGAEVVIARNPLQAVQAAHLAEGSRWPTDKWNFEILNIIDEPIGTAQCNLEAQEALWTLSCSRQTKAYEVHQANSIFMGGDVEQQHQARWSATAPYLLDGNMEVHGIATDGTAFGNRLEWQMHQGTFYTTFQDGSSPGVNEALPLAPLTEADFLVQEDSWPWQISALPLQEGYSARVMVFRSYTWQEQIGKNAPMVEPVLVSVTRLEMIDTSAGKMEALRVEFGDRQVAWYIPSSPARLIRYFTGAETWAAK